MCYKGEIENEKKTQVREFRKEQRNQAEARAARVLQAPFKEVT